MPIESSHHITYHLFAVTHKYIHTFLPEFTHAHTHTHTHTSICMYVHTRCFMRCTYVYVQVHGALRPDCFFLGQSTVKIGGFVQAQENAQARRSKLSSTDRCVCVCLYLCRCMCVWVCGCVCMCTFSSHTMGRRARAKSCQITGVYVCEIYVKYMHMCV